MTLVWHIAKKDLRRLALPVGVWLALILVPGMAFHVVSPPIHGHAASSIDTWRTALTIWLRLIEGIQFTLGYVLAGALVLEDALVGTTTFWATRPIGNARLFAGKLLAASILFIMAPCLVLTPLWLAAGFGATEIVHAAAGFAARFGIAVLLALMTASVAKNLAQFLFFSLLIGGVFAATGLLAAPFLREAPMALRMSREWLVLAGALPAVAVVMTH